MATLLLFPLSLFVFFFFVWFFFAIAIVAAVVIAVSLLPLIPNHFIWEFSIYFFLAYRYKRDRALFNVIANSNQQKWMFFTYILHNFDLV